MDFHCLLKKNNTHTHTLTFLRKFLQIFRLNNVDMKQMDYQFSLQPKKKKKKKWGEFILDVQCFAIQDMQPWQATCMSHWTREGELFYREEKEVGRTRVNTEFTAFHWLNRCQERKGVLPLPVGLC